MSAPADLTLTELLPLLELRVLSARELLADCLDRVDRHEADVQAFVVLTPDLASAAAGRADASRAAGDPVGPLAGVPVALKDLYLTRGVPTTASSRVLEGHEPGVDATVWTALQRAGAGLLGKTTLHEFAYGTGSVPTRNPWDLGRTPGGSSGGSAAALAARMVPLATGSDTGGSLRIPAAACGVSSLRPTHGGLSTDGLVPLSPSLDTAGPMARRMLDVAFVLDVLTGAAEPTVPAVREDLRGVRIGVPAALWDGADPDVDRLCAAGLQRLVDRGAVLVEVEPPAGTEQVRAWPGTYGHVMGPEALAVHATWLAEREELYGEEVLGRLRAARETTPEQYARAQDDRRRWALGWRALVADQRLDAVAHPTNLQPPGTLPGHGPSIWPSKAWSVTGFPCLSVPVGVDPLGLPVGLALAGLPEQQDGVVGLGVVLDEDVQLWRRNPLDGS